MHAKWINATETEIRNDADNAPAVFIVICTNPDTAATDHWKCVVRFHALFVAANNL